MKILFINSIGRKKWGGGSKWMTSVAEGLSKSGHEVIIACRENSKIAKIAAKNNVPTLSFSVFSDFDIFAFFKSFRILKREKFDAVVCVQNRDVKIVGLVARLLGQPKIIFRQGLTNLRPSIIHKLWIVDSIHGIVVNARSIRDKYMTYGWFDPSFIKVIYNGVDDAAFPLENSKQVPVHKNGEQVMILASGRLVPEKGFQVLLEVAKMARGKHENWNFVIMGTGKYEKNIKDLVNRYNLNDRVVLTGFCRDTESFFQAADIFVHPSFYEGMPNALMEAMAHGLACVATDVDGTGELIRDGENGLLVAPGSAEALYLAITRLLENPDLKSRLQANARQTIREQFKLSNTVLELEKFIASKI